MRIFENDRKNIEKNFSNCRSSFWLLLFSYSKGTFRSSFSSSLSWYRWHVRKATAIQRYGNLKVDLLCKYGQNRDFRPWPDIFKKSKITLKSLLCKKYVTRRSSKVLKCPLRLSNHKLTRLLKYPAMESRCTVVHLTC